jgi:hypothetical protein
MSVLSPVLRSLSGGLVAFWCPGCDQAHQVRITGPHAWGYNGNPAAPTFTPSVKVTWPAHPEAEERFKEWRTERICHSFVKDGLIQFLGDCTHSLAGQTVPLPPFPEGRE